MLVSSSSRVNFLGKQNQKAHPQCQCKGEKQGTWHILGPTWFPEHPQEPSLIPAGWGNSKQQLSSQAVSSHQAHLVAHCQVGRAIPSLIAGSSAQGHQVPS